MGDVVDEKEGQDPLPTSIPPTTPVASREGQVRVSRTYPSSTVRWNVDSRASDIRVCPIRNGRFVRLAGGATWVQMPVMSGSSLDLPAELASARKARSFVAECAARMDRAEMVETAQLLVSELVTNAVAHAGTAVEVECVPTEGGLRVSVWDGSRFLPSPGRPDEWDERGRGLVLVDTLASRWGAHRHSDNGKAVWFELVDQ